jgi:AraC-like DNA-binding protein/DNA gyrase inhibitor GyrI
MDKRIHKAVRMLEGAMAERVNLDAVAAAVGLSRAQFNRLFVAATGEAPSDYLRRIRLDAAAARLRWTRQSVGTAAVEVGYDSQPSFTQAFTRRYGVPPVAFRQDRERWPDKDSSSIHERRVRVMEIEGFTCWARRYIGPTYDVPLHWRHFLADLPASIRDTATFVGLLRDDLRFTPPDKVRYDCAVVLDAEADASALPDDLLPVTTRPSLAATVRHRGGYGRDERTGLCVANTYAFLLDEWMSASRHTFAAEYALEIYSAMPGRIEPDMAECTIVAPIV